MMGQKAVSFHLLLASLLEIWVIRMFLIPCCDCSSVDSISTERRNELEDCGHSHSKCGPLGYISDLSTDTEHEIDSKKLKIKGRLCSIPWVCFELLDLIKFDDHLVIKSGMAVSEFRTEELELQKLLDSIRAIFTQRTVSEDFLEQHFELIKGYMSSLFRLVQSRFREFRSHSKILTIVESIVKEFVDVKPTIYRRETPYHKKIFRCTNEEREKCILEDNEDPFVAPFKKAVEYQYNPRPDSIERLLGLLDKAGKTRSFVSIVRFQPDRVMSIEFTPDHLEAYELMRAEFIPRENRTIWFSDHVEVQGGSAHGGWHDKNKSEPSGSIKKWIDPVFNAPLDGFILNVLLFLIWGFIAWKYYFRTRWCISPFTRYAVLFIAVSLFTIAVHFLLLSNNLTNIDHAYRYEKLLWKLMAISGEYRREGTGNIAIAKRLISIATDESDITNFLDKIKTALSENSSSVGGRELGGLIDEFHYFISGRFNTHRDYMERNAHRFAADIVRGERRPAALPSILQSQTKISDLIADDWAKIGHEVELDLRFASYESQPCSIPWVCFELLDVVKFDLESIVPSAEVVVRFWTEEVELQNAIDTIAKFDFEDMNRVDMARLNNELVRLVDLIATRAAAYREHVKILDIASAIPVGSQEYSKDGVTYHRKWFESSDFPASRQSEELIRNDLFTMPFEVASSFQYNRVPDSIKNMHIGLEKVGKISQTILLDTECILVEVSLERFKDYKVIIEQFIPRRRSSGHFAQEKIRPGYDNKSENESIFEKSFNWAFGSTNGIFSTRMSKLF